MVNKVILVGNLGSDAEVRRLESGVAVAKLSVATNESYKDKNGEFQTNTEWHNVVVWRYLAERAEQQCKKGKQVYIEGKLTHRKYQDANGNEKYITEVVGAVMRVLGVKEGGDSGYMPSANDEPAFSKAPASTPASNGNSAATPKPEEVSDAAGDDLPF
ncbi:MAG: single-strand DNA-binding protein [Paraglaciecola sp.]|jgi:single-strand DNA-binding protein